MEEASGGDIYAKRMGGTFSKSGVGGVLVTHLVPEVA